VSGRKKEKEERRDVRSTRYLMDQGNDDVKSKRKSGLLRSSFARPHLPAAREGEYKRKKKRGANQSRMEGQTKKERDSSLLPFNQFFDRPIFIFFLFFSVI
jgi:hypothetical protein